MKTRILSAGIDVDDKAYHVSVFDKSKGIRVEFKCGPNPQLLLRTFKRHELDKESLQLSSEKDEDKGFVTSAQDLATKVSSLS